MSRYFLRFEAEKDKVSIIQSFAAPKSATTSRAGGMRRKAPGRGQALLVVADLLDDQRADTV